VAALITGGGAARFWFVGPCRASSARTHCAGWSAISPSPLHFVDFIQGLVRSEAVTFYLVVAAVALTLSANI